MRCRLRLPAETSNPRRLGWRSTHRASCAIATRCRGPLHARPRSHCASTPRCSHPSKHTRGAPCAMGGECDTPRAKAGGKRPLGRRSPLGSPCASVRACVQAVHVRGRAWSDGGARGQSEGVTGRDRRILRQSARAQQVLPRSLSPQHRPATMDDDASDEVRCRASTCSGACVRACVRGVRESTAQCNIFVGGRLKRGARAVPQGGADPSTTVLHVWTRAASDAWD